MAGRRDIDRMAPTFQETLNQGTITTTSQRQKWFESGITIEDFTKVLTRNLPGRANAYISWPADRPRRHAVTRAWPPHHQATFDA